jgi:spore coat protein CotH
VKIRLIIIFFITGLTCVNSFAQVDLYDINHIREVRITFAQKNWRHLLDSLFQTGDGKQALKGDISIDGTVVKDAGIRYKGFSSVNIGSMKNPFNVDLEYSVKNRNYQGYMHLKLGSVIYDPSFLREVLSYEVLRKYMPASLANYANVYVNDTLLGLYTNVESVSKPFIEKYWTEKNNTFIKGEPAHLEYPFGENSNLAYTHGPDSTGYVPFYELESDYGWSDLFTFIYKLNKEPDSIEKILNTDRTLWMHAFNYVLLNLDSYIGYSQNYYIYKDNNGRFNPIIWDMNMSFASFRHSDGSYHFNGLTIDQMKTVDPLGMMKFTVSPRPLVTQLLSNTTCRKSFLAHMRTLVNENFRNDEYYNRGAAIRDMIDNAVLNDPNKFYSYEDFRNNLDSTTGKPGSTDEFPGIREIMDARVAYLDTYPGFHGEPSISEITHNPDHPSSGEQTWITAKVSNATSVMLGYRLRNDDIFHKVKMTDDGNHHDGTAGDNVYGAGITCSGYTVQYYIYAENDSAAAYSPERAEYEYYMIQPDIKPGYVVINEFLAVNSGTGSYPENQYEGWIELCNNTSENFNLKDLYLTDDAGDLLKWRFPDTSLMANKYLIVWADANNSKPNLHANFSLNKSGGKLLLANSSEKIIDSVTYGEQADGKSAGRYPNGYGKYTFMEPSYSNYNYAGTSPSADFLLYPNPAWDNIYIEIKNQNAPLQVSAYNTKGQLILNDQSFYNNELIPVVTREYDISQFARGAYYFRVICRDNVMTKKLIIY